MEELAHMDRKQTTDRRMTWEWRVKSWLIWPEIPYPPKKYWETFRWYIRKVFLAQFPEISFAKVSASIDILGVDSQ